MFKGKEETHNYTAWKNKRGVLNVKSLVLHAGSIGLQITAYKTCISARFTAVYIGQISPYYVLLTRRCSIEIACRKVASK